MARIPPVDVQVTGPSVGFDARFLWINIDGGGAPPKHSVNNIPLSKLNALAPGLNYPFPQQFIEHKQIGVPQNAETFGYHPAGTCIYCGTKEYAPNSTRELGEEHVIAGSLGAALVLPNASCRMHEKITSQIETKLIQQLFDPTRKHHGIRKRDRKPILKANFRVHRTVDGQNISLPMPIKDHPTVMFLPQLAPPGIITGRPKWMHGIVGACLVNINAETQSLKNMRISSFATPFVDSILFAQMPAKIGHGFASAEILA